MAWWVSVAVILIAVIFSDSVFALESTVIDSRSVSILQSDCAGVTYAVTVRSYGRPEVCFEDPDMQAGMVSLNGNSHLVFRLEYQQDYMKVEGVCSGGATCYYSTATDTLFQLSVPSLTQQMITVFNDFSRRLQLNMPVFAPSTWRLNDPQPTWTIGHTLWGALHTFSVSLNGRWLVAELREKGVILVDTASREVRRIDAPGYQYGRGLDPRYSLAVNNTGTRVIVAGENVGFHDIAVTPPCGQRLTDESSVTPSFPPLTTRCLVQSTNVGSFRPQFRMAYHPRFHHDEQYSVIVLYTSGRFQLRVGSDVNAERHSLVALGDSFTSGEGETDDTFYIPFTNASYDTCHVSRRSYPYLVAPLLQIENTVNVACSGARLDDVQGHEQYRGQHDRLADMSPEERVRAEHDAYQFFIPGRVAQLSLASRLAPQHVMISIGGNDAGITAKLQSCAGPGTCFWAQPAQRYTSADEIDALRTRYVALFSTLRTQFPSSTIEAVGYPLAVTDSHTCNAVTSILFNREEREFMRQMQMRINTVMAAAAQDADVLYRSVERALSGHELCSASPRKAMNGFRFGDDAGLIETVPLLHFIGRESFHPTPWGHELLAAQWQRDGMCPECDRPRDGSYWIMPARQETFIMLDSIRYQQETLTVAIPPGMFAGDTSVAVSLHSDQRHMTNLTLSPDGSTVTELRVPQGVPSGYHSVLVRGYDRAGEALVAYAIIAIDKPVHIPAGEVTAKANETSAAIIERQTEEVVSGPADTSEAIVFEPTNGSSAEEVLGSTAATPTKVRTQDGSLLIYLAIIMLVGIISLWTLFVLLLKNLSQHGFSEKLSRWVTGRKR